MTSDLSAWLDKFADECWNDGAAGGRLNYFDVQKHCTELGIDYNKACEFARRILYITPQPSAARLRDALRCVLDIGTRRLLLPSEVTHWEALLAESDAAVGAQGDAFDAVLLRQAVARGWCAPENAGKEMDVDLAHAIVREVLALQPAAPAAGRCQECCGSPCECPSGMKGTAPAAGKGVERIISEMRGEAYAFGSSWVSGRKLAEWANRLSALTRQSVAKVSTRCSICGEPQWNSPSGVTCDNGHGGAAPAATPTDGGEG